MERFFSVVTSIQEPTVSIRKLDLVLKQLGATLVVVGDSKGPKCFDLKEICLFTLDNQLHLPFQLVPLLPVGHYARKNLGYLTAFKQGASYIYETDDDNAPNEHWRCRTLLTDAMSVNNPPWLNVYRLFSEELIWPRGFPLRLVSDPLTHKYDNNAPLSKVEAPIQQSLVDISPDVDAVWRLVLDRDFRFSRKPSVHLPIGTWCPFNSQSTWWWPKAYPLMYLPSFCSFRMTDIWRSFIAQRCLWEMGNGLVFHAPEVEQDRNTHNLMRDFMDEVPGYEHNESIIASLMDLSLKSGPQYTCDNLMTCYQKLVKAGYFPKDELSLVRAWIKDVETLLHDIS
jgi:hypothetical protein